MPWMLIVDDNKMFRQVFRTSLLRHLPAINIKEAESAEMALAKISESPPHLMFVDIQLPGENGLKLTKKVKSLYPQTMVIVCTNFDSNEYRLAADRVGADYFISKSAVKINELIEFLKSHIEQTPPAVINGAGGLDFRPKTKE
jgi:DNA-binding NarL/FixJ family response regulator